MKLMFSAGEASGDLHGARLAEAILQQAPDSTLLGFGGAKMRAAGVRLVADIADYSVMGFFEVLKNLRHMAAPRYADGNYAAGKAGYPGADRLSRL